MIEIKENLATVLTQANKKKKEKFGILNYR